MTVSLVKVEPESWLREGEFPTVKNCNPNRPDEAFLPFLVGLPGMKGASMALPISYLRMWSTRLWGGGARRVGRQRIFYHPPRAGEINPMFAAGEWKREKPVPNPAHDIDISKLSVALQTELARQVDEKRAAAAPPKAPSPQSFVGRVTWFDPNEHPITDVLAHLRTASPAEIRRVILLERDGSKRRGILKRYEEIQ